MKIFRKVRLLLIRKSHFSKYAAYALGEILLIVVGILFALQVDNWNTIRLERKVERQSYENIQRQIMEDKYSLWDQVEFNNRYLAQFEYASQLIEKKERSLTDTLGVIAVNLLEYSDFDRNNAIYQNLLNSGELKYLGNREVINRLQRLEEAYSYVNRMERIHLEAIVGSVYADLRKTVKFYDRSVQDVENLFGYQFQNHFQTMIDIMREKDAVYHRTISEIEEINVLIDEELRGR